MGAMDVEEAQMYRNIAVVGMVAVLLAVASLSSAALAEPPIAVGSGRNTAVVLINFGDGANFQFDVSFDGETTGIGLLDMVESETALETVRGWYDGDGNFVENDSFMHGISYKGHGDAGYGGGEDWWHYWVRTSEVGEWEMPWTYGAADRLVGDGTWDGWVYGRGTEPVPEPATLMLLLAGGLAVVPASRRRMQRGYASD